MIIDGIDLTKPVPADVVGQMYLDGRLRKVAAKGYVAQANADGTCQFVHFTQTTDPAKPRVYTTNDDVVATLREGLPPIRRRTPQQRAASLMLRFIDEAKRQGKVPGLSEEQARQIIGEYWKEGVTEMTAEAVQRVAAEFLATAEKEAKATENQRYWK